MSKCHLKDTHREGNEGGMYYNVSPKSRDQRTRNNNNKKCVYLQDITLKIWPKRVCEIPLVRGQKKSESSDSFFSRMKH